MSDDAGAASGSPEGGDDPTIGQIVRSMLCFY